MRGKGAARLFPGELAELDREGGRSLLAQLLLQAVDLLVGERPVHRAVGDAIAVRGEALFGVREGVDQVDPLDELASDAAAELEEVVRLEALLGQPEGDVLEAGRVLGVGLELCELARLELGGEPLVARPEEADVGDLEEHHRQPLEAEPEGPAVPVRQVAVGEDAGVDDAAAEHLHPVAVVVDLELEGWLGEGEVLVDPPLLHRPEERVAQPLQRALEVVGHELAAVRGEPLLSAHLALADERGVEEADALHLVEGGEVRRVDLVAPVHVPRAEERLVPLPHQRRLVGRRVCP
mmetsp:Transcript_9338/g.28001  ORF Transcript_9338/g.28001 Transcript_9338/m.28001 type:complete len:294 (+) Transcript_9338:58-939(+)